MNVCMYEFNVSSSRDRLSEAVSHHGRISQSDFVQHVTSLCMSNPETHQAYTSLLRRRQLGCPPPCPCFSQTPRLFAPCIDS